MFLSRMVSLFYPVLALSVLLAPVAAVAHEPSFAERDAKGYGDDQFSAFVAGSKTAADVPALSELLAKDIGVRRAPVDATIPAYISGTTGTPTAMPLARFRQTSAFGNRWHPILGGYRRHAGVDLAAAMGTPILATADGVARTAQWQGGYGLLVEIAHDDGYRTRYGHMSQLNVRAGQIVHKGDTIGYVGSTGRSTGPHLHYEVLRNGKSVDPAGFIGR